MGKKARQKGLFGDDIQAWYRPKQTLSSEEDRERSAILAALSDSDLGRKELRVAFILHNFPETRDSDTALAVRYWERFQADILEAWDRLDLDVLFELDNFETLSRLRRHLQNDLNLFQGTPRTRELRGKLQLDFARYMAQKRQEDAEIRFYLDETGTERQKRYTGLGGICVLDWRQYEKHHAALVQWRLQQGWPETLHFADISQDPKKHLSLLSQLRARRAGLLFVGHALPSRGHQHFTLVDLFIQLVVDSVRVMEGLGCLEGRKALQVIKEADEGFDRVHGVTLDKYLGEYLATEFSARVYLRGVTPVAKGREVMLECADLIAGAMQRRALFGGRNAKDVVAEAAFNVTGFGDKEDPGAVYKAFL